MLEINKGKHTTLFSSASIPCISCVNRSASWGSRGRRQFLLLVMRNSEDPMLGSGLRRAGEAPQQGWEGEAAGKGQFFGQVTAQLPFCCWIAFFIQRILFCCLERFLNSWINCKCSHLSLSWAGLNTHSSALNPSLKHAIKSNTFLVNKLIYKQFYSRATYQNYVVNKTSMFTLNIGQLLGRISNPCSCRATPQTPQWNLTHRCTFNDNSYFFKYQNFSISYTSAELVKVAAFQVGRRTFFREQSQRRWHLPRAHKWSTNFCLQLDTINFRVALVLTVGCSSIGTPIIYYQTLQRNQNILLPRKLCSMRTCAAAEFKF